MQKNAEALLPADLRVLRTIYTSIRDGMSNVAQWFDQDAAKALKEKLDKTKKKKKATKKAEKPPVDDETKTNSEPEEPERPEVEPEPEDVTGDSEQENEEVDEVTRQRIMAKMQFRPKPGPVSQWQRQVEQRMERGRKALEQLGDEDPEYSMTLSALQVLEVFEVEDVESLDLDNRLKFRNTLDQVIQGFEAEITDGEQE